MVTPPLPRTDRWLRCSRVTYMRSTGTERPFSVARYEGGVVDVLLRLPRRQVSWKVVVQCGLAEDLQRATEAPHWALAPSMSLGR